MSTVDDVQGRIAAILDQNESLTDISSSDYSHRLNLINQREQKWAEVGKWRALLKPFNTRTSASTGNTSVSLPADFRAVADNARITFDGANTKQFSEIRSQDEAGFGQSDTYFKVVGNTLAGHTMVINPTTTNGWLASGASIKMDYFSLPTSLASPANVIQCPNPDYIVSGVIADVWESKADARFQQKQAEADRILANMLEFEFTPSEGSFGKNVKTTEQVNFGFRWGR